jgi:hypothetical protein
MTERATRKGLSISPPIFPAQLIAYVRGHDPAAAAYDTSSEGNPYWNRRILAIAGGKDTLVPWSASQIFFEKLEVGPRGVKELFVDGEAGHKWTDSMGDRMMIFIEKYCLL